MVSINKISGKKQNISIIGMVYSKKITKNKNMLIEIEDLTGRITILINKDKEDLYKKAEDIALDSIIGLKGSGSKELFFVSEIIFPEANLNERKRADFEEYALFLGDLHFGSKLFLKKDFLKFIDYINGKVENTPEVKKIKYLFLVGDLVTGVGNYPNQENDLEIQDLEQQFIHLAKVLNTIRKDIKIIISPGNHDGVRLMEPQPMLDEKYAWPIYEIENVIITTNPSTVNIGSKEGFQGFDVLTYHGFSFTYYANNVPKLMIKKAMNTPEEIIKYLLKQRHLAPTHASNQYFPTEKDSLVLSKIPDIILAGHTHKSAVSYYNNILIISTSCWESMTPYQEKFGNKPDHCKVPMFNLKTRAIKILDFEFINDGIFFDEETRAKEDAIKDIAPQAKLKKIEIGKEYDKNLSQMNLDPGLITVIFQNLVSNSIKYTPEGGKIIIAVKKDGKNALISVKDAGCGIPKDTQPKIFDKFYRADNARIQDPNGSGLGLYIVKAIVEKSSGKIWFESEENKGTTFFVSLPLGTARSK